MMGLVVCAGGGGGRRGRRGSGKLSLGGGEKGVIQSHIVNDHGVSSEKKRVIGLDVVGNVACETEKVLNHCGRITDIGYGS